MNEQVGYKKTYRIRYSVPGSGKKSVEVTIPYEVIKREADKRNLTVDQFIQQFMAIAEYDNFDGIRYTFQKANNEV